MHLFHFSSLSCVHTILAGPVCPEIYFFFTVHFYKLTKFWVAVYRFNILHKREKKLSLLSFFIFWLWEKNRPSSFCDKNEKKTVPKLVDNYQPRAGEKKNQKNTWIYHHHTSRYTTYSLLGLQSLLIPLSTTFGPCGLGHRALRPRPQCPAASATVNSMLRPQELCAITHTYRF